MTDTSAESAPIPVRYVHLRIAGIRGHRVGDDGSVWTCLLRVSMGSGRGSIFIETHGWRKRRQSPDKKGYMRVTVPKIDGGYVRAKVHQLVLVAFDKPKPEGMECRHLDDDKRNNSRGNLCWGTPEQNREDRRRNRGRKAGQIR